MPSLKTIIVSLLATLAAAAPLNTTLTPRGHDSNLSFNFGIDNHDDCFGLKPEDMMHHTLSAGQCWDRSQVKLNSMPYTTTHHAVTTGCKIVFYNHRNCHKEAAWDFNVETGKNICYHPPRGWKGWKSFKFDCEGGEDEED